jgi:hypothetical protein
MDELDQQHLSPAVQRSAGSTVYHAPELQPMGTLKEITRGGADSATSDSGQNMKMPP